MELLPNNTEIAYTPALWASASGVWFGEVFTDKHTLSLDRARELNPSNPEFSYVGIPV